MQTINSGLQRALRSDPKRPARRQIPSGNAQRRFGRVQNASGRRPGLSGRCLRPSGRRPGLSGTCLRPSGQRVQSSVARRPGTSSSGSAVLEEREPAVIIRPLGMRHRFEPGGRGDTARHYVRDIESKAERVAANGRPLGRGSVSREHGLSLSTRVGCSRTGPEMIAGFRFGDL